MAVVVFVAQAHADPLDISDKIFKARSADCADYVAAYSARARDVQGNRTLNGALNVTTTGTTCTLSSNSVPKHAFNTTGAHFVKPVAEIDSSFTISRNPAQAKQPTALSQRSFDVIMLNGVVLDILSAGCHRPSGPRGDQYGNVAIGCSVERGHWILDPLGPGAGFGPDAHNAHTQPDGRYHYHGNPMAMFDDHPGLEGSPVIGFAADGFTIFGSYFVDSAGELRRARSGYTLRTGNRPAGSGNPGGSHNGMYIDDYEFTNAGDLDACNGMTVNGLCGYYVTDSYPWVLNCFQGTPDSSFDKGARR